MDRKIPQSKYPLKEVPYIIYKDENVWTLTLNPRSKLMGCEETLGYQQIYEFDDRTEAYLFARRLALDGGYKLKKV